MKKRVKLNEDTENWLKFQVKHTPGPWKVEKHPNKEHPECMKFNIWNQNTHVCTIHEHIEAIQIDETNARLISASPEMLDALKMTLNVFENIQYDGMAHKLVKAAIKKAEGNE